MQVAKPWIHRNRTMDISGEWNCDCIYAFPKFSILRILKVFFKKSFYSKVASPFTTLKHTGCSQQDVTLLKAQA